MELQLICLSSPGCESRPGRANHAGRNCNWILEAKSLVPDPREIIQMYVYSFKSSLVNVSSSFSLVCQLVFFFPSRFSDHAAPEPDMSSPQADDGIVKGGKVPDPDDQTVTRIESNRDTEMVEVDTGYLASSPYGKFYRSVLFQMILFGAISFVGPAMSDAISNLGGGGLSSPYLSNLANALNYAS